MTFTFGNAELSIDKETSTLSDVADSSDLAISPDTASRIGTENDGISTASQKVLVGDNENALRVEVADADAVIRVDGSSDELTQVYLGDEEKGSGVNIGDFDEEVFINLNTNSGKLGDNDALFQGINKLQGGGSKNNTLVGAFNTNNTIAAGNGNNSIWGGHGGMDSLVGADSDVKSGSTSFFYMTGGGRDVIDGFEFLTDENSYKADKIDTCGTTLKGADIVDDDLVISLADDLDRLTLKNARNRNIQIHVNGDDNNVVICKVNNDSLDYDGIADYLKFTGKNGAVDVNSSLRSAEIWLNNDHDYWTGTENKNLTSFEGDIRILDASNVEGNVTLVGNNNDNIISAGQGNSTMWGGHSDTSNDTLYGGAGDDKLLYGLNEGDDVINSVEYNDLINLYNIRIEDIKADITATQIKLSFTGGHSLTVNTNNSGVGFKIAGSDDTWTVDQQTRVWSTK